MTDEIMEDEKLVFLEPREVFDKMIIGICQTPESVIAYDKDQLISYWRNEFKEDEISEDDAHLMAVEWFEFNVAGAYWGVHTPIYISTEGLEEYLLD
tara:strand:- start:1136 stop:1426 length:291 start_codon:yes stop_codon:yes gene_type:complete